MNLDKYLDEYRHQMQSGDSIIWGAGGFVGYLIAPFCKGLSHVSTIVRVDELDVDRVYITEANLPGIQFNSLTERIRAHNGKVWWLPLKPEYDAYRQAIRKWAMEHIGKKYDIWAIPVQIWRRVNANARKMFCSEFDFLAKKASGIPELQEIVKAPKPHHTEGFGINEERIRLK